MLRFNGILPSQEECFDKNKSAFIRGYNDSSLYLHNIASSPSNHCKIRLFNREIDNDTMKVLEQIINFGIESGSSYSNLEIYCCRPIVKKIDLVSLEKNSIFKNITIYQHPEKDIFHDRFLSVYFKEENFEDIYLMGSHFSSIIQKPMSIAQIIGKCIVNLDEETEKNLKNELSEIVDKSDKIYPKEEL